MSDSNDSTDLERRVDAIMNPGTAPEVPAGMLKDAHLSKPKIAKPIQVTESKPAENIAPQPEPTVEPVRTSRPTTDIDDPETDKAVKDIVAHEADIVLDAEDNSAGVAIEHSHHEGRFKRFFKHRTVWAALLLSIIALAAVPTSRNHILGVVIHRTVTVHIIDGTAHTPVSSALVSIGDQSARTDAKGVATLRSKPGEQGLRIEKKYYRTAQSLYTVRLTGKNDQTFDLIATGRQIPVTMRNTITGAPIAGVEISAQGTNAKTDGQGKALLVVPASLDKVAAIVKSSGYNTVTPTITVTDAVVPENSINLTPAGKVYYLSDTSGTLDVMRANLDGSGRSVVFAGTGNEDRRSTVLVASRDWRYVALKARHDGSRPALFVIDTTTNKVTQFDGDSADFNTIGWSGDVFYYDSVRSDLAPYQAGREVLKAYDAVRGEPNRLDANLAEGDRTAYSEQVFGNFNLSSGLLSYTTDWEAHGSYGDLPDLGGKNTTIRTIAVPGQIKRDAQTFVTTTVSQLTSAHPLPDTVTYTVTDTGRKATTYTISGGKITTGLTALTPPGATYLPSPSGKATLFDAGGTLQRGDTVGSHAKTLASGYAAVGWYGDSYVLAAKGTELYVLPSASLTKGRQPVLVTDAFRQPASLQ